MKRLVIAAAAAALLSTVAQAAPRAESPVECGIAADMAVVAHSLAARTCSAKAEPDHGAHLRRRGIRRAARR
jgi:hypothetical protein